VSIRPRRQAGEGRIGFLIALALFGVGIFLAVKVIPVRVAAYQFRDVLREEARHGAVRLDEKTVSRRILERAAELEVPLDPKNLRVRKTLNEIVVEASYEQPVDFKVTTWRYRFDAEERVPLLF
jgi:hypothetical protein